MTPKFILIKHKEDRYGNAGKTELWKDEIINTDNIIRIRPASDETEFAKIEMRLNAENTYDLEVRPDTFQWLTMILEVNMVAK